MNAAHAGDPRTPDPDDLELKAEIDEIAGRIDQIIDKVKEYLPTGESSNSSNSKPDTVPAHSNIFHN